MKKLKRSERLVEMTQYLLNRPHSLIPLTIFAERYSSAKSSISEDLAIIKEVFQGEGLGDLQTMAGAAGGVRYIPRVPKERSLTFIEGICRDLEQSDRILPGGYMFMSDILGMPATVMELGRTFASIFADRDADVVITIETKGIPLAYATASFLNLPVIVVRRDHSAVEGSAVSINYVSGSAKRIHTMSLGKRSLKENARVLIIDDFMRAGGTIQGIKDLLVEFHAEPVGVGIFMESGEVEEHLFNEYVSLARITEIDTKSKLARVVPGNYFTESEADRS